MVRYWTELMLSGFDNLLEQGLIKEEDRITLLEDMNKVKGSEEGIFFYSFIQGLAKK